MEVTRVQPTQDAPVPQHAMPVSLTAKAVAMVKEEMAKANLGEGWALRIAVTGGGCSGFQYDMDFANETRAGDLESKQDGLRVLVDERSAAYLTGTQVDYVAEASGEGFKFLNPNAKKTCGCGTSFSAEG